VQYKRELHIFADSDQDKETLKKRAVTEARRRKAQGLNVTLTMSTWSDDGGKLWKVGRLHHVIIPVDQVDDVLIISEVGFDLTAKDRKASVTLVDKDSYSDKAGAGKDKGKAKGKAGRGKSVFAEGEITEAAA
jgi:prophage tail gpP-like protein